MCLISFYTHRLAGWSESPLTRIADRFVDLVGTTSRDIALSSTACPAPVRQPVFRFRGLLARFVLARAVLFRYATGANNAQLDHCNTRL